MAQRLNGQMDVGVFVVEVLDEDTVVIVPERFDRKRPRQSLTATASVPAGINRMMLIESDPSRRRLSSRPASSSQRCCRSFDPDSSRHRRALLCFGVKFAVPGDVGEVRF